VSARALVVASVLIAPLVFFVWRAAVDPAVYYLAAHPGAEWIQMRLPPSLSERRGEQSTSVARFTREFELARIPAAAGVEVRALREWWLSVNGIDLRPTGRPMDWKASQSVDLGEALRVGGNRIEVTVRCERGPPSLWLRATGGLRKRISSGPGWGVEEQGRASRPAALASYSFGQPFALNAPGAIAALQRMAGEWISLFVASALAFSLRARLAGWTIEGFSERGRALASAPNLVTLVAGLAWIAVGVASAIRAPQAFGPDVVGHIAYLKFVADKHALPLATDGWSTYHPPLFYVLSSLIRGGLGGANLALKLLPFAAGLGQVLLARWVAGRIFPQLQGVQALVIVFAASLPMNLYVSQFFSNEGLAGFLIGLTICQAIVLSTREQFALREFAWLGLFAGLALLTKYTALVAVVAVLAVLAAQQLARRRPISAVALSLLTSTGVALGIAGGYYARNLVRVGSLFPGNWEFDWWQDPGFHSFAYWTRFGGWLANPFKIGLNSFPDSLYATLFGDAMLSGGGRATRAGFDRDFVAAMMLIALPAFAMLAIGAVRALVQVVRAGSIVWSLVLLPTFGLFLLVAYASSTHPYYSTAKSFFALGAVVPLALLFAAGFHSLDELVAARAPALRIALYAWLGTFSGGVFLAYLL